MNNEKRNEIFKEVIRELNANTDDLEMIAEEEQESLDNVEEHFPGSMRAMNMEECVDGLNMAIDDINDIIAALEDMIK